jgi:selenide,water dikinase
MKVNLLDFTDSGGCSAKIPPKQLEEILSRLPLPSDPDILVNIDKHDDAGVYRISDELALVLTTDFFPPVCSDPYEFGEIAAANSISDVYAMGGKPVLALSIMMFPANRLPKEAYGAILEGATSKAAEAGVSIIGGHTIDDLIPKFGLAVTGFVNPSRVITNSGARPGNMLILTKPVGSGIVLSGHKAGIASDAELAEAKVNMKLLNKTGAEVMSVFNIKGATDITGFGLAGHALKMAKASGVSIHVNMKNVPLLSPVLRLADDGCLPSACFTNLAYCEEYTQISGSDYNLRMIAHDAQTSGGLMISVSESDCEKMIGELKSAGLLNAAVVGHVKDFSGKYLHLEC